MLTDEDIEKAECIIVAADAQGANGRGLMDRRLLNVRFQTELIKLMNLIKSGT